LQAAASTSACHAVGDPMSHFVDDDVIFKRSISIGLKHDEAAVSKAREAKIKALELTVV